MKVLYYLFYNNTAKIIYQGIILIKELKSKYFENIKSFVFYLIIKILHLTLYFI